LSPISAPGWSGSAPRLPHDRSQRRSDSLLERRRRGDLGRHAGAAGPAIGALGLRAIEALAPKPGERILDIGCGAGQSTLALAQAVGPAGLAQGLDISRPLLTVAEGRAREAGLEQARFLEADAQTHAFEPASFDGVFSRFGVMFFADPTEAFRNIRTALKPGGRLAFVCWRSPAENVFMSLPAKAVAHLLPPSPPPVPHAPGPFAFADGDRLKGILETAGFSAVTLTPHDQKIGSGDLEQTLATSLKVGPPGAVLRENPHLRDEVIEAVRTALAPIRVPRGLNFPRPPGSFQPRPETQAGSSDIEASSRKRGWSMGRSTSSCSQVRT